MYCMLAWLQKDITLLQMLLNWLIVFIGNILACFCFASLIGYLGQFYTDEPYKTFVKTYVEESVNLSWGVCLIRSISGNWLACLSLILTIASQEMLARIVSCFLPLFALVAMKSELVIANMSFVPMAILYGADINYGVYIYNNLIPCLLGNLIGAFMSNIGLWVMYLHKFESKKDIRKSSKITDFGRVARKSMVSIDEDDKDTYKLKFDYKFVKSGGDVMILTVDAVVKLDFDFPVDVLMALREKDSASSIVGYILFKWNSTKKISDCKIECADECACTLFDSNESNIINKPISELTYSSGSDSIDQYFREGLRNYWEKYLGKEQANKNESVVQNKLRMSRFSVCDVVRSSVSVASKPRENLAISRRIGISKREGVSVLAKGDIETAQ
eukprot:GHVR01023987.1.p1 GENE.GHVR01023987.1~~GHVR01023987.1.p1  ORF type:complete len:454 (+),score=81.81 GHVR01023987.1:201-1364(+)